VAKCRSCRAKINWTVSELGKKMPLDPLPVADGNVIKTGNRVEGLEEVHVISSRDATIDPDTPRYVTHFSTCPMAAAHRKERTR
jgi:hypothetical protein